jgi:hypothetical protein
MSKSITVIDCAGYRHDYESTLFRGYHAIESPNGVCIVEKRFLRATATVACYSNSCDTRKSVQVEKRDCVLCSAVNPTQRL